MVYDVNKRGSYESCCDYWLNSFREVASENAVIVLVGNQVDRQQREVSTEEAKDFADQSEILFIETSAVLNSNVVDAF